MKDQQEVVIITGLSGSGKTVMLRALEDIGYFCLDNMPVSLLPQFLDLKEKESFASLPVAMVTDVRMLGIEEDLAAILKSIKERGIKTNVVFLEASHDVLINRFKATRRVHPLTQTGRLEEAIKEERVTMASMRELADLIIDTSDFNVHQLSKHIRTIFGGESGLSRFNIIITSFGFGLGMPRDADMVFDVRFLPNPYFVASLKDKTGIDKEVVDFIKDKVQTKEFLVYLYPFVDFLISQFHEGRTFINIAVGCTGGQHRSVCIAEELKRHLQARNHLPRVYHRDLQAYLKDK